MTTSGPERDDSYGAPDTPGDDTDVLGLFGGPSTGSGTPTGSDDDTAVLPDHAAPSPASPPWSAGDTAVLPGAAPATSTAPPVGGTPGATEPSAPYVPPAEPEQPPARLRVGTVVWGLIIAMVGVGILAAASGAMFDRQLALIALLGVAGVALLVGSILTARRPRG